MAHTQSKPTNIEKLHKETITPKMTKKFGYRNPMQVPKLVKVVVNMGVGKATEDIKILEEAARDLSLITGQKPNYRRAKKSISNFKIRQGQAIGCSVTLRKRIMYEFVDRLLNVALPRIRDFRGVSPRGFDTTGNYSMGLKEQTIFPEVPTDRVTRAQGMDITFVTTATTKDEALHLLYLLGVPFRGKDEIMVLEGLN
jgi:large subunit ribosomal protein L5